MDYLQYENTYNLDDEYMMGKSILIAPIFGNDTMRNIYLPDGNWYCFWTHKKYSGGQKHEVEMPPERISVFVKEGALLPIARPIERIKPDTCFEITIQVFGSDCPDFVLYEDDGISLDFSDGKQNRVILSYTTEQGGTVDRQGNYADRRYSVIDWRPI